jgi:hypothetical protein
MRGSRVKRLRADIELTMDVAQLHSEHPVRPGRKNGGPAISGAPYPKSYRIEKRGDLDVLQVDPEFLRAQTRRAEAGI